MTIRIRQCILSIAAASGILTATLSAAAEDIPEEAEAVGDAYILKIDEGGKTIELPYVIAEDGSAVVEGDIVIGDGQDLQNFSEPQTLQSIGNAELFSLFTRFGDHLWKDGVLFYSIPSNLSQATKDKIAIAMTHWESKTKIRFKKAVAGTADYVEFVDPGSAGVCNSRVGRVGGRQIINLGSNCSAGNAVHEIGHALGLTHEQMRKDRDAFVTFKPENLKEKVYESNFTPKPTLYVEIGSYCYGSVMHYPRNAFAKPGTETLVPTQQGVVIGQRVGLDACDIKAIETQYAAELQ